MVCISENGQGSTATPRGCGSRSSNNGMECINVLLSIMEPFVDGFRYQFEWQSSHNGGGCITSGLMDTDGLKHDYPGYHGREALHGAPEQYMGV